MDRKKKDLIRNPIALGIAFVLISAIVSLAIPHMPGGAVVEVLISIAIMSYGYVHLTRDKLSKAQRLWISIIYFVAVYGMSVYYLFSVGVSGEAASIANQNGALAMLATIAGVSLLASLFVYLMMGVFSDFAYEAYLKINLR